MFTSSNADALAKRRRQSNKYKAKALNEWIYAIVQEKPKATLQDIADEVGLTRERIRQIINISLEDNDLKPIHRIKRRGGMDGLKMDDCVGGCGKSMYKVFRRYANSPYMCHPCRKREWEELRLTCTNCGRTFSLSDSYKYHRKSYKRRAKHPEMNFCSKSCLGEYSGRNFGFGANRKNINKR